MFYRREIKKIIKSANNKSENRHWIFVNVIFWINISNVDISNAADTLSVCSWETRKKTVNKVNDSMLHSWNDKNYAFNVYIIHTFNPNQIYEISKFNNNNKNKQ